MTTIPGHHMMAVRDINDDKEVFAALLRDHEELVMEVHRLQQRVRDARHWSRLWKAEAWVQREKRRLGV